MSCPALALFRRLYNKFIDDPELRLSDNKLRTAILREYYEKR